MIQRKLSPSLAIGFQLMQVNHRAHPSTPTMTHLNIDVIWAGGTFFLGAFLERFIYIWGEEEMVGLPFTAHC
jgi:hypothetical protein